MGSTRAMPSGVAGSPLCEISMRADFPSGDRKMSMTRLKSAFSNISGGR